jgi:hypothetical protein
LKGDAARPASKLVGLIMKFWSYIERHHEDFGVALFVIPVLLLALLLGGIGYGMTLLLSG